MICLDSGVMVETAAVVEAQFVGEGTVIEVGAKVGQGCVIGKVSTWSIVFGHSLSSLVVSRFGLEFETAC